MGVIDKLYEFELVKGLNDRLLRVLYNEVRHQMKMRKLLIYDAERHEFVPNYPQNNTHEHSRKQQESTNMLFENRHKGSLTGPYKKKLLGRHRSILIDWLQEDWSDLFTDGCDKNRKYYVYYHCDPTSDRLVYTDGVSEDPIKVRFTGKPFYIGKGCGDRFTNLYSRNTSHLQRVRYFESQGYPITHFSFILCDNLTEREALEMESKLIAFFGCMAEVPANKRYLHGGQGGMLINSDIGRRPYWIKQFIKDALGHIHNRSSPSQSHP